MVSGAPMWDKSNRPDVLALLKRAFKGFDALRLRWQVLAATLVAALALWSLHSEGGRFVDLWLTPDQQGQRLYDQREYAAAAERFEDPAWVGTAQYRAGQYTEAAQTFSRLPTAEGFFNRGDAHMKAFEYAPAVTAFELSVQEAPDWLEAQENLALARHTLAYVERSREQSDTGEAGGIGADDVAYDNTGERGEETEVTRESAVEALAADKWMRTVDTDTAEFLRSRFQLEASRRAP